MKDQGARGIREIVPDHAFRKGEFERMFPGTGLEIAGHANFLGGLGVANDPQDILSVRKGGPILGLSEKWGWSGRSNEEENDGGKQIPHGTTIQWRRQNAIEISGRKLETVTRPSLPLY
jgi:hypothetical protein